MTATSPTNPSPSPVAPPRAAGPWVLASKTARTLAMTVAVALALPLVPGLERLNWWPDELWTLVPRALRPAGVGDPPEVLIAGVVDDDELLALAPRATARAPSQAPRPKNPPASAESRAATAPASTGGTAADAGLPALMDAPPAPGLVVDSDAPLPPPPKVRTLKSGLPLMPIEDPQHNLRRFYGRLARIEAGAPEIARVLHYGDSMITGDYVTGNLRRLLQRKFGDAGHGFILAGRPAPWYGHENVKLRTSNGWDIFRLTRPTIADHRYGLGAAAFSTRGSEWVEVSTDGPTEAQNGEPIIGANTSKMQVFYLAQPSGGKFRLEVDGHQVEVNTRADKPGSRMAEIQAADGPHTLKIKTLGYGEVRLFGAVLEREGPGVVYDSLGLDGTRAKLLQRMNPEHWHDQLRLRKPDLLVLHYGTNESQAADLGAKRYRESLSQVVGHLRAALPGVSCLLVGPMDRAERDENGKLVSRPVVKRIVDVQRQVAYAQGCAFWNTWQAMGGEGSMAVWYRSRLGQGDLTHPTRRGADRVAAMLFAALMDGYGAHQARAEAAANAGPTVAPPPAPTSPPVLVGPAPVVAGAPASAGSAAPSTAASEAVTAPLDVPDPGAEDEDAPTDERGVHIEPALPDDEDAP